MTDQTERNRDRARRYVEEVLSLENLDAIEEIAAPPSEWDDSDTLDGTAIETYEETKRYLERTLSQFEDWSLSVESIIADGDEVVAIWHGSGRIVEEWFGIPATGRPFETEGFSYLRFKDGRIVAMHEQIDRMDFMPEVAKVARRGIAKEMRDGIVVVDEDERIIDVNPATIDTFQLSKDDLLGSSAEELLGSKTPPEPGESVVITGPDDRRYFEVEASPLTASTGEPIGRTLVLREITERRRHAQQLEVLNRVLRHNLRNDLTVVQGHLETAQDRTDEAVALQLAEASDTVAELLETAETARAVQTALEETAVAQRDLARLVASLVDRAREQYPTATIETTVEEVPSVEATDNLADGLWELLANACEHAGERPHVEVTVGQREDAVEMTIADDGPGIPNHERAVLDAGQETDLHHGSGLGLWLAHWVLDASGGSLSFSANDGTTVRVSLPC